MLDQAIHTTTNQESISAIKQEPIRTKNKISFVSFVVTLLSLTGFTLQIPSAQATPLGDAICSRLVTVLPCNRDIPTPARVTWGMIGELSYPLAAQEMYRRNPLGFGLTPTQKSYLRPYFGNLVDRVTIHYNSLLLTEIGMPTIPQASDKKISIGNTIGQTFGLNIYLSEPYKTNFQQLALIAHELVHSRQYEQRGSSLVLFGKEYFEKYEDAGKTYEGNVMEQEAYTLQYQFIENDCASKNFSGFCPEGTSLSAYDYDYVAASNVISFSLAGELPEQKEAVPVSLSQSDQQKLTNIFAPACTATYDPSPYRPGTPGWDGRIGKIAFYNGTNQTVKVTLYHPDAPNQIFDTWDIEPGANLFIGDNSYGMDWGIKVDNSNTCIVGLVSDWNYFNGAYNFQTWPERLR